MKKLTVSFAIVLGFCTIAGARDAAQLKADLTGILPAGKTSVRLAWIKGGPFTEFALDATSTAVYVAGSADGVIRRLYPTSSTGRYCNVNISADGSRVFFLNQSSGRTCVINWDGTGFKEVSLGGEIWEYWRNPADGSDWAIVDKNGMSRVKIDAPATAVTVANMSVGGDGCGLSDDGTKFFGYDYNHSPAAFGVITVSGLKWTYGPHGGCQGSLSGGNAPKYNHNPSGHTQLCVHDAADQSKFTVYASSTTVMSGLTSKGLNASCQSFASNEGARFAQHPDFITFYMSNSKANPILMRLPDMKFVYIEDGLSCGFCGDMDAVFLSGGTTGVSTGPSVQAGASLRGRGVDIVSYSLDGRRLGPAVQAPRHQADRTARGVVVRTTQGSGPAAGIRVDFE